MDNNFTFSPNDCIQCGKPIHGRVDKRFCDVYCRMFLTIRSNVRMNKILLRLIEYCGKTGRSSKPYPRLVNPPFERKCWKPWDTTSICFHPCTGPPMVRSTICLMNLDLGPS